MPNTKRNHESCRELVCAVCYCSSGLKADRLVSVNVEAAIKQFHTPTYSVSDSKFPSGICKTCSSKIYDWINGKENARPLPSLPELVTRITPITRTSSECSCKICHLARLNGPSWRKYVLGIKKQKNPETMRLCSNCYSPIYRGSNHGKNTCKSSRVAFNNLTENVNKSVLEKVGLHAVKAKVNESGENTVEINSITGGRPTKVTVGAPNGDKDGTVQQLTVKDVSIIQNEASLSDRQVISVLKNLRRKFGWKTVEPHLRKALVTRKQIFSDFFSSEMVEFQDKDGKAFTRVLVYCNDVVGFVELVAFLRNCSFTELTEKIGIDYGKNFRLLINCRKKIHW